MRVLVTGGAGFIGATVVRRFLREGAEVVVFDKLTYAGRLSSLAEVAEQPGYKFIRGDVADAAEVAAVFAHEAPDAVLHMAAESHVDRSISGAGEFVRSNIVGTYTLLEAARAYWAALPEPRRSAFRLHYVSTDEVFGSLGASGWFDEESRHDPRSPYSASKAAADHLVSAWAHTYGLPVLITHCSNNYGPFQQPEKLIPLMICNALEGRPLPVYGDGRNVRDWLAVEDHAAALWTVLTRGGVGAHYCIGGRAERTNLEVVHAVCDLVDALAPPLDRPRRALVRFVADRPGHDRRYAVRPDKIEQELGWRATVDFDRGVAATVRWYLENRWWWAPLPRG